MIERVSRSLLTLAIWAWTLTGPSVESFAGQLKVVASFNGTNGGQPWTGVTLDANGNIYGTTINGGPGNGGTVFEINQGSHTINTLVSFTAGYGNTYDPGVSGYGIPPTNGVALYDGQVYGTTVYGGPDRAGTIFSVPQQGGALSTISWTPSTIFGPTIFGATMNQGIAVDSQGNIYGTAIYPGSMPGGTYKPGGDIVWEIAHGTQAVTALAVMSSSNQPVFSSPTIDSSGNIYGSSESGGPNGSGFIWEVAKGSNAVTTLAVFPPGSSVDPIVLPSTVTVDSQGNLYGTTQVGGAYGNGYVWELAKGSGTITILSSFTEADGQHPSQATIDKYGNLFMTTYDGGQYAQGGLYELASGSNTLTLLGSFGDPSAGGIHLNYPSGTLAIDANGDIFGTAGPDIVNAGVWEYVASVPEPSSMILSLIGVAFGGSFALLKRIRAKV